MRRDKVRYYKLPYPSSATVAQRLHDLKTRACHYAHEARKSSDRILRQSKKLKFLGLIFSTTMVVLVTADSQLKASQGDWIIWVAAAFGLLASGVTVFHLVKVDENAAVELLAVVRDFSSVAEKVTRLQEMLPALGDEQTKKGLEVLYAEHISLKDKYLERIEMRNYYYHYNVSQGPTHKVE